MWPLPPPALVPVGTDAEAARAHIHLHLVPAPTDAAAPTPSHVLARANPYRHVCACTCTHGRVGSHILPHRWELVGLRAQPSIPLASGSWRLQHCPSAMATGPRRLHWPVRGAPSTSQGLSLRYWSFLRFGFSLVPAVSSAVSRSSASASAIFCVWGTRSTPFGGTGVRHRRTGSLPCELKLVARPTVAHWHTGGYLPLIRRPRVRILPRLG
jgi:hypothetical protein